MGKANSVEKVVETSYIKLQILKARPFQIIIKKRHRVVRREEKASNSVTIHIVTADLGLGEQRSKTAQTHSYPKNKAHTTQQQRTKKRKRQQSDSVKFQCH